MTYFNRCCKNKVFVVRFGLKDLASIAHNCLYGPISLFPNSKQIPYGSQNSVPSTQFRGVIFHEGGISPAEPGTFTALILKRMLDKHFTIFSEIIFGLSASDDGLLCGLAVLTSAICWSFTLVSCCTMENSHSLTSKNFYSFNSPISPITQLRVISEHDIPAILEYPNVFAVIYCQWEVS